MTEETIPGVRLYRRAGRTASCATVCKQRCESAVQRFATLQVDGVCKVAPVVALLAGDPSMLPTVDTAVRVVQNTDKAAAFACGFARVLEKLVLGTPTVQEAIAAATKDLMDPSRSFKTTLDQEVAQNLERVLGELSHLSHADAGKTLKPEAVAFPFAGLS